MRNQLDQYHRSLLIVAGDKRQADDRVPFEEKMNALTSRLAEQFARGAELEKTIREKLKGIGYGF